MFHNVIKKEDETILCKIFKKRLSCEIVMKVAFLAYNQKQSMIECEK